MRDYRVEIISSEPNSDYWFVEYVKGLNEFDALEKTNKRWLPDFEANKYTITEIMQ